MVYNAYSYENAFKSVESIILTDKNGERYIMENIDCNPANVNEEKKFMRQGGAAIAVLENVLPVVKAEVFINEKYDDTTSKIRVSDLKLLAEKQ